MANFNTIDEILDFAIGEEEKAAQWYADLAKKVRRPGMKAAFLEFSAEEKKHKAKLMGVKKNKLAGFEKKKIKDLKIADYTDDVEPSDDMDYQDALMLAMKKEKGAYLMYNDLASKAKDEKLSDLFLSLAAEEANHKLKFEIEYDQFVMQEN